MTRIFTDASYCYETGTGTYAYFIYADTVHTGWGTLKNLRNSNDAELHAIYMALCNLLLINCDDLYIFWTDSLHGIQMIHRDGKSNNNEYPIVKQITRLLNGKQYNFNYAPRNSLPELWWCDQKCKEI